MFSSSSPLSDKYTTARSSGRKTNGNRKRNGYELTRQRSMLPIALGAALASVVVYAVLYHYVPNIITFEMRVINSKPKVKDNRERVIVRKAPDEKAEKADDNHIVEDPNAKPEIVTIPEPEEITDVLDANVEKLILAPGPTDLSVPEPTAGVQSPVEAEELKPGEITEDLLAAQAFSAETLAMPEPTPINSNEVMVNATAQLEEIPGAEGTAMSDLSSTAKEGMHTDLPGDTRTLEQLIGESNLGASSGVARLGSDLLFGFNECKLKSAARITMLQLAALIQKNPQTRFIIEGHTDSIGGDSYNALLSMQRAAAVRDWLSQNKIPTDNVYIRACADNTPLADKKGDREQQALNRRVEIHMRTPDEALPEGCENHTYKVDLSTKLGAQLAAGVLIPKTYSSASANLTPEQKAKPADKPKANPQQNNRKPRRNNNNGRRRRR